MLAWILKYSEVGTTDINIFKNFDMKVETMSLNIQKLWSEDRNSGSEYSNKHESRNNGLEF